MAGTDTQDGFLRQGPTPGGPVNEMRMNSRMRYLKIRSWLARTARSVKVGDRPLSFADRWRSIPAFGNIQTTSGKEQKSTMLRHFGTNLVHSLALT